MSFLAIRLARAGLRTCVGWPLGHWTASTYGASKAMQQASLGSEAAAVDTEQIPAATAAAGDVPAPVKRKRGRPPKIRVSTVDRAMLSLSTQKCCFTISQHAYAM